MDFLEFFSVWLLEKVLLEMVKNSGQIKKLKDMLIETISVLHVMDLRRRMKKYPKSQTVKIWKIFIFSVSSCLEMWNIWKKGFFGIFFSLAFRKSPIRNGQKFRTNKKIERYVNREDFCRSYNGFETLNDEIS